MDCARAHQRRRRGPSAGRRTVTFSVCVALWAGAPAVVRAGQADTDAVRRALYGNIRVANPTAMVVPRCASLVIGSSGEAPAGAPAARSPVSVALPGASGVWATNAPVHGVFCLRAAALMEAFPSTERAGLRLPAPGTDNASVVPRPIALASPSGAGIGGADRQGFRLVANGARLSDGAQRLAVLQPRGFELFAAGGAVRELSAMARPIALACRTGAVAASILDRKILDSRITAVGQVFRFGGNGVGLPGLVQRVAVAQPRLVALCSSGGAASELSAIARPVSLAFRVGVTAASIVDGKILDVVLEEVRAGRRNARDPRLREEIAWYFDSNPYTPQAYALFVVLVDGSAGNTPRKKSDNLRAWAETYRDARYASIIAYYAAYHAYRLNAYDQALGTADEYIGRFQAEQDRLYMLKALCYVGQSKLPEALDALRKVQGYPQSTLLPHAQFLSAWVHLQEGRTTEARVLLQSLPERYPDSPYAAKARQLLQGMDAEEKR